MEKCKFYQLFVNDNAADLNIYGDITSDAAVMKSFFGDDLPVISAKDIVKELMGLNVKTINVYINSYGGEVAEALAIYSALKRHQARIHTFADGFACSAASIIFCAGDQRTMGTLSLLMIHNCMTKVGYANSEQMRKAAEDNDKINQSSINAYMSVTGMSEKQIRDLMDAETWFTAEEALQYKFATDIAEIKRDTGTTQQSGFRAVRQSILQGRGYVPVTGGKSYLKRLQEIYSKKDDNRKKAAAFFGALSK